METSQPDNEFALADLIGDLLNVAYDDTFLNEWLNRCASELGCQNAALLSWESGKPDSQHSLNYGADNLVNPEWCEWFSELMRFYIPEGPCLLEDVMTALFNAREWAGDYDLEGLIGMAPALPATTKIALITWRRDIVVLVLEHAECDGWTQDDAQRIRFIAKHLANANKVLSHVYNCRWGASVASSIMDAAPRGFSVLGPGGHVGYVTSKLRRLLDMDDGVFLTNGKIHFVDPTLEKTYYENVKALEGKRSGAYNVTIDRPSGKPAFQLMLVAMSTTSGHTQTIKNQPFLTIFIHNPNEQVKLSRQQLQHYFGFTKAEANVAKAAFKYNTLQGAADSLNISINTVRTHLRRVYEKAGVNNQSELMRALSGALRTTLIEDERLLEPMITVRKSTMGSVWRPKD